MPTGSIADGSPVIFDTVVNNQSTDISYSTGTGEFTITAAGNYDVTWWVATNGAGAASMVSLGVVLDTNAPVTGLSPNVTGQVVGNALITVTTPPGTVTLVNNTGDVIFFAGTPIQADLVIEEVT
jgi:hypothetical protein